MIESYPSIYNLGHAALDELLRGDVVIEEKIDGSQFSFGRDETGELQCRSKGAVINLSEPEPLFEKAVQWCLAHQELLPPGRTFRCEYLAKPKHNVLAYGRTPENNLIVFDITAGPERYFSPAAKKEIAAGIGLETVPLLHVGPITGVDQLKAFLETNSVLGGQKVEGIVIKPAGADIFGRDKKLLIGKLVSEDFKEVHKATWKAEHGEKTSADILEQLARCFATPARWAKARIHLAERGGIEGSLRDIGPLMKEVGEDVARECEDEIKDQLFKWAWPRLKRSLTRGLPEWYKAELIAQQESRLEQAVS
jgi:hypothetical protein